MNKTFLYVYLVIVISFSLNCAGVSQQQEELAKAQFNSELDYCLDKWKQELLTGQTYNLFTRYVVCTNKATTTYTNNVKFPYPEIIPLSNSYNLALAERVDTGYLTREQYLRLSSLFRNQLIYDASQRERKTHNQRSVWNQILQSINSQYLSNRPIQCMQMGNMITCN